jgi:hypothetical protein
MQSSALPALWASISHDLMRKESVATTQTPSIAALTDQLDDLRPEPPQLNDDELFVYWFARAQCMASAAFSSSASDSCIPAASDQTSGTSPGQVMIPKSIESP